MAERGGQQGNKNGARGTDWRDAIRHALAKKGRGIEGNEAAYRKGLQALAQTFIEAAEDGEAWAMKELGDRTDGKAAQSIEIAGPDGGPIQAIEWTIAPVIPIVDETDAET